MKSVQCFDGDGVVPPELQALMKENQRLMDLLRERDMEIRALRKQDREREQVIRGFGNKLWQIQAIVNAKDAPDDEYPVKPNWDGNYEKEPESVDDQQTFADQFKILIQKNNA